MVVLVGLVGCSGLFFGEFKVVLNGSILVEVVLSWCLMVLEWF